MTHHRVKDISYDQDELGDYDEEELHVESEIQGVSVEDEQALREGTVAVRQGLGEDSGFSTDKEIQDALWYYYFDAEKSVAYLRKQKQPQEAQTQAKQQSQKQKQASRFEEAQAKASKTEGTTTTTELSPLWSCTSPPISSAGFFVDTPFLSVPAHRLGSIIEIPRFPRGGLLGGSNAGKPSKLAALAASRKKAAEDKRKAEAQGREDEQGRSPVRALDRLGKRQRLDDVQTEETRKEVEALKLESPRPKEHQGDVVMSNGSSRGALKATLAQKRAYPKLESRPESKIEPKTHKSTPSVETSDILEEVVAEHEDLVAEPSLFANSLFASKTQRSNLDNRLTGLDVFSLPLARSHTRNKQDNFSKPSPDDIVLKAQQSAKGAKNAKSNTPSKRNIDSKIPANEMAAMEISRPATPSKAKSKNIDVATEYAKSNTKKSANFVVIGHVDHGKSTLMGRLLFDTQQGQNTSPRAFSKLSASASAAGKSSFSYAWLLDSTSEERSRGITVDVAQQTFSTPECDFTILDAPGHKDFVPNMIAGASQADFAVLVVDASRGEFEKGLEGGGQTKEHALLIRGLGVGRVIVAVNKMDQVQWNKDRFQEIEGQMIAFLVKVGFKKGEVRCVPCAGLTGENVAQRIPPQPAPEAGKGSKKLSKEKGLATPPVEAEQKDAFPWYTGPTLLETLSSFSPQTYNLSSPLRMTIANIFRGGVTNPLSISGRLDSGSVQVGDVLLAMPSGESCTVKGIDADSGRGSGASAQDTSAYANAEADKPLEYAVAGQIATLHLVDVDPIHLRLGDVLCSAEHPVRNVKSFTAKVLAFEHLVPGALDCHRGRMHCAASVTRLLGLVEAGGKEAAGGAKTKRPRVVKPGQVARVVVVLERALPLEVGERVVLRAEGSTAAAGLVEAVAPGEGQGS